MGLSARFREVVVDVSRCRVVALCAALLLSAQPPKAVAQWAPAGTALSTAPRIQTSPVAVPDGAGGAVVAWVDVRDGGEDVYAQRVSAAGVPQWAPNGVPLSTARGDQGTLDIVADGSGGAIVVWHDYRCGSHLYAQHINANGALLWNPGGVLLSTDAGWQLEPHCVADGLGGVIVLWTFDGRGGLYAQRLSAAGGVLWGANGRAVSTYGAFETAIAADGSGGAVFAYTHPGSGYNAIFAQRLDPAGTPQWAGSGVLLNPPVNYSARPSIASTGAGGAIVAWADARAGNALHIFAQRLDGSGVPLWTPNGVAVCTAPVGQDHPVVVANDSHGAIVAWLDSRNGGHDIFARGLGAGGDTLWITYGRPVCVAAGDRMGLAIARDGAQGAILAWQDHRGADWDVYAQRITQTGDRPWTANGLALSGAAGDQTLPALVPDGAGGAIAAWGDARVSAASSDVYAARVDSTGSAPAIVGVAPDIYRFRRLSAAPNPFRASTTLSFELPVAASVSVAIFDLSGSTVRTLASGRLMEAGPHTLAWDAHNTRGELVTAGVYFARIQIGRERAVGKVVVVR
jgi:hypothetical protein